MTETTINNSKPMAEISDEQLTQFIIDAIQDKKGRAIAVVDLSEIESAPCNLLSVKGALHSKCRL